MKIFNKHSIAAVGLILAISATPSTAVAKGNLHLDLPGISINVGDHRGKSYYRKNKRYYNSNRRGHSSNYRRNNYYNNYRNSNRRYNRRNDNYNYNSRGQGYYQPQNNYNNRYRRVEVCPIAGYSPYIDNSRGCYEHKNHYHCE